MSKEKGKSKKADKAELSKKELSNVSGGRSTKTGPIGASVSRSIRGHGLDQS